MERANGFERGRGEYMYNERVASNSRGRLRTETGEDVPANSHVNRRGKERIRRMEHLDDEYSAYSRGVHNRMDDDLSMDRPEYIKFQGEDNRTPLESRRSRPPTEQWGGINGAAASYCPPPSASGHGRFEYLYHDQGPPRYSMNDYYYEESERARYLNHGFDRPPGLEDLENDRAELIRKLDELTDQLNRSGDQRMISPTTTDPYPRNHAAYIQQGSTSSHGVNKQPLAPDDMTSTYSSQASGFVPYSNRHSPSLRDSYPQRGYRHEFMSYADTYQQEMSQRPSQQPQSQNKHWSYHEHIHGYHGDVNHDHYVLHPNENLFDHPACSCAHCCNKNWCLPPQVEPLGFYDRRSRNELSSPNYQHHVYPNQHGPHVYNSNSFSSHTSHSQQSLALNSTNVDSKSGGIDHNNPQKVVVAHRNGKVCHPIAGGAPFIACSKCFEVLKLSGKHMSLPKYQHKLKCGACSSIILFELGSRGSTVPISGHVDHVSTGIDDVSSFTVDEKARDQHSVSSSADMNTSSNDSEPKVSPVDNKSISDASEKQLDRLPSALSLNEDEQISETLASENHGSPSAELPVKEVEPFPHPHLCSKECTDHCSADIVVNQSDQGNKIKRSDSDQNTPQQNYVEDSEVTTQTDMSLNDFTNSSVSQDSMDKSKEHHPMVNKGVGSLFTGLIKKSVGEFRKPTQNVEVGKSQVFVNGHSIPDHLVEKAEKLAGPVQPGEYWYDVRAGFWGVMGYPCLGVIMPNIEEFNYPMPENCAAGNTGVFVNGRELHQKDLNLLVGRGLPNTRHGYYLVDISGQVVDEHTGEELNSIGKLAPTVERAKQGFGMKVPSFIARLKC